jgi:hypothetical protein
MLHVSKTAQSGLYVRCTSCIQLQPSVIHSPNAIMAYECAHCTCAFDLFLHLRNHERFYPGGTCTIVFLARDGQHHRQIGRRQDVEPAVAPTYPPPRVPDPPAADDGDDSDDSFSQDRYEHAIWKHATLCNAGKGLNANDLLGWMKLIGLAEKASTDYTSATHSPRTCYQGGKQLAFIRWYEVVEPRRGQADVLERLGCTSLRWEDGGPRRAPRAVAGGASQPRYGIIDFQQVLRQAYIVPDFAKGDGFFKVNPWKWDRGEPCKKGFAEVPQAGDPGEEDHFNI